MTGPPIGLLLSQTAIQAAAQGKGPSLDLLGPPIQPAFDALDKESSDRVGKAAAFEKLIGQAAAKYGISPVLLKAMIEQESGYNPGAYRFEPRRKEASYGLMQVLESTARGMGLKGDPKELYDPAVGIDYGARYLKSQLDRKGGDEDAALSAYNNGHGQRGGDGRFANQDYVDSVRKRQAFFEQNLPIPSLDDLGPPLQDKKKEEAPSIDEIEARLAGRGGLQHEGITPPPALSEREQELHDISLVDKKPDESRRAYIERVTPIAEAIKAKIPRKPDTIGPAPSGFAAARNWLANIGISERGSLSVAAPPLIRNTTRTLYMIGDQIVNSTASKYTEEGLIAAGENLFGTVPAKILHGIADPLVTAPGQLITDALMQGQYLLPEEASEQARLMMAGYAGLFVGMGAGRLYGAARTLTTPALETLGTRELSLIASKAVPTGWRAGIIKGMFEGATGGAAAGMIEAPPGQRFDMAASYALMALPLGIAFEGVMSRFGEGTVLADEKLRMSAADLSYLRQLRIARETSTDEVAAAIYNMASSADLAKAIARTGVALDRPVIITGMNKDEAVSLQLDLEATLKERATVEPERFVDENNAYGAPILEENGVAFKGEPLSPALMHRMEAAGIEFVKTAAGTVPIARHLKVGEIVQPITPVEGGLTIGHAAEHPVVPEAQDRIVLDIFDDYNMSEADKRRILGDETFNRIHDYFYNRGSLPVADEAGTRDLMHHPVKIGAEELLKFPHLINNQPVGTALVQYPDGRIAYLNIEQGTPGHTTAIHHRPDGTFDVAFIKKGQTFPEEVVPDAKTRTLIVPTDVEIPGTGIKKKISVQLSIDADGTGRIGWAGAPGLTDLIKTEGKEGIQEVNMRDPYPTQAEEDAFRAKYSDEQLLEMTRHPKNLFGLRQTLAIQKEVMARYPGFKRFVFQRVSGARVEARYARIAARDARAAAIETSYRAGQITPDEYTKQMNDIDRESAADPSRGNEVQNVARHKQNLELETQTVTDDEAVRRHFSQTGFLPYEEVSYLGFDYRFAGAAEPGKVNLTDRFGGIRSVRLSEVRHGNTSFNAFNVLPDDIADNLDEAFRRTAPEYFKENGDLNIDAKPERSFNDAVRDFAKARGMSPEEVLPLTNFLLDRFGKSAFSEILTGEERGAYRRLMAEIVRNQEKAPASVTDLATSSGMMLERNGPSGVTIRDVETGNIMAQVKSLEEAGRWLNFSGKANGPDLDSGGNFGGVPPSVFGDVLHGPPPPPNGPHAESFTPAPDTWLRRLSHAFNVTTLGRITTGTRQVIISFDNIFSKLRDQLGVSVELYKNVFDPVVRDAKKMHAASHESLQQLADIAKLTEGMTPEETAHITNLMDLLVTESVPITQNEADLARVFNDMGVDVAKARVYQTARQRLRARFADSRGTATIAPAGEQTHLFDDPTAAQGRPRNEALEAAESHLRQALGVDEGVVRAADLLDEIPESMSVHNIARAARHNANPVTAADYITEHNLNPKVVKVANDLKSLLDNVAKDTGFERTELLNQLYPLYRDLGPKDPATPDFISDLLYSGEASVFEGDPISSTFKFVRGAYYRRHLAGSWEAAAKYVDNVTPFLPDGEMINRYIKNTFLNEIRGIPREGAASTGSAFGDLAQDFFREVLKRTNVKVGEEALRKFVDSGLNVISAGTLGARVGQGIRDLDNFVSNFYTRLGARRTANMIRIMSKVDPEQLVRDGVITELRPGETATQALQREGVTPGMSPVATQTPEERLGNTLAARTLPVRRIIQNVADKGIKWGLQHNVYQWAHAASYLESLTEASEVLTKLVHGGFGEGPSAKAAAYKSLLIDTYDLPVIRAFDQLVTQDKFREAAEFLGRASSFETVPLFGLAQHPSGWGTTTGKLLGQYGSYSVWQRSQLARVMSRGTTGQRAKAVARFAISQGAKKAASLALGLNLNSWYLAYGALGFRGGPIASALGDVQTLVSGAPDYKEDEAIRNLSRTWMLGIPFSYLAKDVVDASNMAAQGGNPISVVARLIGIRSTEDPSLINPYGVPKP